MRVPNVMEVNPSVPAKTVAEFIAYAKANPGKINLASSGNGTSVHLSGELFKMMTGVNMLHVPYRGSAPMLTDLLGGQVQVMFDNMPSSIQHIQSRQAARAGGDHGDALGGAAGYADGRRTSCRATRRAPGSAWARRKARRREIIDKLNKEINAALADPEDEGAARRSRRHADGGLARRFRQDRRRGNREMGEGGQVLRREARNERSTLPSANIAG